MITKEELKEIRSRVDSAIAGLRSISQILTNVMSSDADSDWQNEALHGVKVNAVKMYRNAKGVTLKAALLEINKFLKSHPRNTFNQ